MSKKITVTISDEDEEYYNKLWYEIDDGNGKVASPSRIISELLLSGKIIEDKSGLSIGAFAIALANPDYKDVLKYFLNSSYEKAG